MGYYFLDRQKDPDSTLFMNLNKVEHFIYGTLNNTYFLDTTVWPRSLDPFYTVIYYIKRVKTSWTTYSSYKPKR